MRDVDKYGYGIYNCPNCGAEIIGKYEAELCSGCWEIEHPEEWDDEGADDYEDEE
jgi:hypothetical protein